MISSFVLLPGDPNRVEIIGQYLSGFKIVSSNREFKVGTGEYKNIKITVCSTGIGGPSTAIAVEELINAGAKYLIRIGTCGGSWREDVPLGSLIIPTACVRDEGATAEYIDYGFPAVGDWQMINKLAVAAQKYNKKYFVGINRTHDAYYGSQEKIIKWGKYLLEDRWQDSLTPILSSDMECAVLYVIATLRGVKAGCVLAVNATPESMTSRLQSKKQKVVMEKNQNITNQIVEEGIKVALEAISSFKI